MRPHRKARIAIVAGVVMSCLLIAALFGAPALLRAPWMRAQLEHELSQQLGGHITWQSLQVRLLPSPRAVLGGLRFEVPGTVSAGIMEATVYLRLLPLLRGHPEIKSVSAFKPAVEIRVTSASPPTGAPATNPVAAYRSALSAAVQAIRENAPSSDLQIEDGSVDVKPQGLPAIELRQLSLSVQAGASAVDVKATSTGNLWRRLQFEAHVALADLSGSATLEMTECKPQAWLNQWLSGSAIALVLPAVNVHARGRTDGRTSLLFDYQVDAPFLVMGRGEQQLQLPKVFAKGVLAAGTQQTELTLSDVRVADLLSGAHAQLISAADGTHPALSVDIPKLDLAKVRDAVLALASGEAKVRSYASRIQAGDITDVHLEAKADAFPELLDLDHLRANALLTNGRTMLPLLEREAVGVSGKFNIVEGKLTVDAIAARVGSDRIAEGIVHYAFADGALSSAARFDLDLAQTIQIVRGSLAESQRSIFSDVQSATGGMQGNAKLTAGAHGWNASVDIVRSDATIRLRQLPIPISLLAAHALASPSQVGVSAASGSLGKSRFANLAAEILLGSPLRIRGASGQFDAALDELLPLLRSQGETADALRGLEAVSGTVQVTLNQLAGRLDQPASVDYEVSMQPRTVSVQLKELPARVDVSGGSIHLDKTTVRLDGLALAMLDARAVLSGSLNDYRTGRLQAKVSVADGAIGSKMMEWIWQRSGAPPRMQPKAPLRLAAQQLLWSPQRSLDARAALQFDSGQTVTVEMSWKPGALDIRRLTVKDDRSSAIVSLLMRGRQLQGRFSGVLHGSTISAMVRNAGERPGKAAGDVRFTIDLDEPRRTAANGELRADAVNLEWLIGQPLTIGHIDLNADGSILQIHEATVNWAQQPATIRGRIEYGGKVPVIDAQIDSPGIVVNTLLSRIDSREAARDGGPSGGAKDASDVDDLRHFWPPPITGRISVNAGFLEYDRYRVAPLVATLTLEQSRALLDVQEARLCGLAVLLSAHATPEAVSAVAHIAARGQKVQDTSDCLIEARTQLTGEFDVRADLGTKGWRPRLPQDLEGNVHLEARNGTVKRYDLLRNVLTLNSIARLLRPGTPRVGEEEMPYRKLTVDGRFHAQHFMLEQFAFDSTFVGVGATGTVGFVDPDTRVLVLVAPFSRTDQVVRAIPAIGYVLGGTFTTVPVSLTGDYRDPLIVPLGPEAITSQLTGIFERTLKLPGKLLSPLRTVPKAERETLEK